MAERHVWIPMADGVRLAASLYLPDTRDPCPVLLEALPYRKDDVTAGYRQEYRRLAGEHGYAVALVDLRGTGSSWGRGCCAGSRSSSTAPTGGTGRCGRRTSGSPARRCWWRAGPTATATPPSGAEAPARAVPAAARPLEPHGHRQLAAGTADRAGARAGTARGGAASPPARLNSRLTGGSGFAHDRCMRRRAMLATVAALLAAALAAGPAGSGDVTAP
jgi:hypothetical protein